MPDDLLRHVIAPQPYSSVWLWLAVGLSVALVAWFGVVLLVTAGGRSPRDVRVLGAARDRRRRHRAARAVHRIGERYRAGDLQAAPAGSAASGELRRFLHQATGAPVEYMQISELAGSDVAPAAAVLERLIDVQFNTASAVDVGRVLDDAEGLILSWS